MRIGILCLMQESNTFLNRKTELYHFEEDLLLEGESIRKIMEDSHHEVGGFFEGIETEGFEAVPIFAARALPFGTISKDAFNQLLSRMFSLIEKIGPLDGYLVAPHGATVSEEQPDADGFWLSRLRQFVGPKIPIIGTLDLHANLSAKMIQATNILIGYQSNPHLDQKERGLEAALLMAKVLRQEIAPCQHAAFPPFVMNIEKQCTSLSPCLELYELAQEFRQTQGLLSLSILQGYPYADVAEMGTSFIAASHEKSEIAISVLDDLSKYLWKNREMFDGKGVSLEEALNSLQPNSQATCLLDMGDNVGGGSPADGTLIAQGLNKKGSLKSFVCLYDPEAVEKAIQNGTGKTIRLEMGGNTDSLHGDRFITEVKIKSLHDGKFTEKKPRHGGASNFDQGATAVVTCLSGLTIMLTSKRMAPFSLEQLRSCGLSPEDFDVLVAKGVNSPLAAYEEVCSKFIRVDTPGVTSSNLNHFSYLHRRRPMHPFETNFEWPCH